MKIELMNNYGMINPTIYKIREQIYIKDLENRYKLLLIDKIEEISALNKVLKNTLTKNYYDEIIKTKQNTLIFIHNGKPYLLIRIKEKNKNIEEKVFKKMILQKNIPELDRSNWSILWSKKNDYMEYKRNSNKTQKQIIDESMDYYLGMAETAIAYSNNSTEGLNKILTLSHKRIDLENINNPLNIIVDVIERDIGEYLKYLFINNKHTKTKIGNVLSLAAEKKVSYTKLYARLLYPNYFFDVYGSVLEKKEAKEKLIQLISRIDEYEEFLRYIYTEINKKEAIKKVDWL